MHGMNATFKNDMPSCKGMYKFLYFIEFCIISAGKISKSYRGLNKFFYLVKVCISYSKI